MGHREGELEIMEYLKYRLRSLIAFCRTISVRGVLDTVWWYLWWCVIAVAIILGAVLLVVGVLVAVFTGNVLGHTPLMLLGLLLFLPPTVYIDFLCYTKKRSAPRVYRWKHGRGRPRD